MTDMNTQEMFDCGDALDIAHAEALYERLSQVLEKGQDITLDASAVERADTAGLQVMCGFMQSVSVANIGCTWHAPTPAIYETAALLDLVECLQLPELG